jgi:hypothetical protein
MKQHSKWFLMSFFCIALLAVIPNMAYSQLGDPGEDPDAPIDGGVSVLVAAGIGYGIKKARNNRKKQHQDNLTGKM